MRYMMLIYGAEDCWTEAERRDCMIESMGLCDQLAAAGKYIDSAPLEPAVTAATLRVRDGRPFVTDGPYAETTEQLGGFYVLDLADLDEAIAVAGRLPPAKKGTVEIRPMATLDGLPPGKPHAPGSGAVPHLLMLYQDKTKPPAVPPADKAAAVAAVLGLTRELDEAGAYVSASPLHPAETATCVRVRDGRRLITDGPFAETNEVLAGYFLIRVGSREDALRVAARLPGAACSSTVEVRQLFDLSALRNSAPISRTDVDSVAARSTN